MEGTNRKPINYIQFFTVKHNYTTIVKLHLVAFDLGTNLLCVRPLAYYVRRCLGVRVSQNPSISIFPLRRHFYWIPPIFTRKHQNNCKNRERFSIGDSGTPAKIVSLRVPLLTTLKQEFRQQDYSAKSPRTIRFTGNISLWQVSRIIIYCLFPVCFEF